MLQACIKSLPTSPVVDFVSQDSNNLNTPSLMALIV